MRKPKTDKPFEKILQSEAASYPTLAKTLSRSTSLLSYRWRKFLDAIDLNALESLLIYFKAAEETLLSNQQTSKLAFLPIRFASNFGAGLYSFLSGFDHAVSDAMRDTIETEFLVRDFTLDPARISQWLSSDERTRWSNFKPSELPRRQARHVGVNATDLPGAEDYNAHSRLLHVGPPLLFDRTLIHSTQVTTLLDLVADFMYHGESSLQAVDGFIKAMQLIPPIADPALTAINSSADDLRTAHGASIAVEEQIAAQLSHEGVTRVVVYEPGIAFALGEDSDPVRAFAVSDIDFRRFHRDVSATKSKGFMIEELSRIVDDDTETK